MHELSRFECVETTRYVPVASVTATVAIDRFNLCLDGLNTVRLVIIMLASAIAK